MPVKLRGATSGDITLDVPAVAGSNTLVLPAASGNIITSADSGTVSQAMLASGVAGNGPALNVFRANNLSLTSAQLTLVAFDTVSLDTASAFNIGTSKFTPLVAGYYLVSVNVSGTAVSALTAVVGTIFKNGTEVCRNQIVGSLSGATTAPCTKLIYMNGTTDFLQCYGQVNGTTVNLVGDANGAWTSMSACLMRAA